MCVFLQGVLKHTHIMQNVNTQMRIKMWTVYVKTKVHVTPILTANICTCSYNHCNFGSKTKASKGRNKSTNKPANKYTKVSVCTIKGSTKHANKYTKVSVCTIKGGTNMQTNTPKYLCVQSKEVQTCKQIHQSICVYNQRRYKHANKYTKVSVCTIKGGTNMQTNTPKYLCVQSKEVQTCKQIHQSICVYNQRRYKHANKYTKVSVCAIKGGTNLQTNTPKYLCVQSKEVQTCKHIHQSICVYNQRRYKHANKYTKVSVCTIKGGTNMQTNTPKYVCVQSKEVQTCKQIHQSICVYNQRRYKTCKHIHQSICVYNQRRYKPANKYTKIAVCTIKGGTNLQTYTPKYLCVQSKEVQTCKHIHQNSCVYNQRRYKPANKYTKIAVCTIKGGTNMQTNTPK